MGKAIEAYYVNGVGYSAVVQSDDGRYSVVSSSEDCDFRVDRFVGLDEARKRARSWLDLPDDAEPVVRWGEQRG